MFQSIEKRLTLIFLFILFLLGFFSIITWQISSNTKESGKWVAHTNQVLYQSELVYSILKDVERGVRGYVITGDSSYIVSVNQSKGSINQALEKLKSLTADNAIQQVRIDSLRFTAIQRIAKSDTLSTIPFAHQKELAACVQRGKLVMDKLRINIASIEAEEKRLLSERENTNEHNSRLLQIILYSFFGLLAILFIISWLYMRYNFSLLNTGSKTLFQLNTTLNFLNRQIDYIIEGITDPFFALDNDFRFIYLNSAAKHKLGYDKGSLTGKNIFEVFTRFEETPEGINIKEAHKTKKPISFEAFNYLFEYWQDVTIYPTSEGLTVYLKDASQRKKAEAELLKTKQFLEETNDVAVVGGWEVDLNAGTVYWSPVTAVIHEAEPGFIPDLKSGINFYKEGKSRDKIIKLVKDAIDNGIGWDTEMQIVTAKGNEKWIRTKGKVEQDKDGNNIRLFGTFQDIDAQKKLEQKLQLSEQQFKSAFKDAAIGIALVNTNGKWEEVNDSLCNIVGYTKEELLQLTFHDITYIDDVRKGYDNLKDLVEGKLQTFHTEKRYVHKQGHIVWVQISISTVKNKDNNVIHLVAQIQDISRRKSAEQSLSDEKKLLRTIIDNIPINIYVKDLVSKKILVNKHELEYMNAISEQDILGKNDYDLYPFNTAIASIVEDKEIVATGTAIIDKETESTRKDGSLTYFLTSKIPLVTEEGKITGILGISYDVTERNKIIRALKATEQKLSALFHLSPIGLALSEFQSGKFLETNKAFDEKLGYTNEELKTIDRLKVKPQKYWEIEKEILASIGSNKQFGPVEMEHLKKNGGTYPMLISGVKINDGEGRDLIWTVVQDITVLKNAESELKQLNKSVAEANKELAIKNEELEQFAYVASHDLQEPLRMITAFIHKIEKKYANIMDDDGKQYIGFVTDGAKRMRALITDILNYSTVDNNHGANIEPVDLSKLIKKLTHSIRSNDNGSENAIIIAETLPTMTVDAISIEQLFANLISNAIKYQPPGNKAIVKIKAEQYKGYWQFSVADNGIGIDPLYFEKVFHIFQRLHRKEEYAGTGIGLAICKKIVNKLKGEIWVESVKGIGTTFFFKIPF